MTKNNSLKLPSFYDLHTLLDVNFLTGKLIWKTRTPVWFADGKFTADHCCKIWNAKNSGKEAFNTISFYGYRCGRILGQDYGAHRIIWKMFYNQDPSEIDHINGVRDDNRIENLRSVTRSENSQNHCRRSDNTSGITGVSFSKKSNKWETYITLDKARTKIGYFDRLEDAVLARYKKEIELGFHPNHGREVKEYYKNFQKNAQ